MKYVKMLGLAAIAASALMAFAGTGAASAASTVCSTTVSPCPAAQRWPNTVNGIDLSSENEAGTGAGKAVLEETSGFIKNECESTVKGTLTNGPAANATLSNITWTWSCSWFTVTLVVAPMVIENIAGSSDGTVKAEGEFRVTILQPSFPTNISCVYGGNGDLGTLKEGNPPTMEINKVINATPENPAGCFSSARLTAKYKLTSPAGTTGSISTS
jgi:hypothetical protein